MLNELVTPEVLQRRSICTCLKLLPRYTYMLMAGRKEAGCHANAWKASRIIRKLSIHLVWSTRVSCIYWAPDSLGMGQGGFTLGICCDIIPFNLRRMTVAFAKVTVLGPSLEVSLYDDSSVMLIMLPAKWEQTSKMLMHILGTKHLLIIEYVKLPELGSWHYHLDKYM